MHTPPHHTPQRYMQCSAVHECDQEIVVNPQIYWNILEKQLKSSQPLKIKVSLSLTMEDNLAILVTKREDA